MAKRPTGGKTPKRPTPSLPSGFRPFKDPVKQKEAMLGALNGMRDFLLVSQDLDIDTRARRNSDGSVDAMLRINRLPRDFDPQPFFLELVNDYLIPRAEMPGVRIRGVYYYSAPEGIDSPDWRKRGMAAAASFGHEAAERSTDGTKLGYEHWREAMMKIWDNMRSHRRRKPETLTIALYWSPSRGIPAKTRKPVGEK